MKINKIKKYNKQFISKEDIYYRGCITLQNFFSFKTRVTLEEYLSNSSN